LFVSGIIYLALTVNLINFYEHKIEMAATSATGLALTPQLTIGSQIGEGAFGQVYEIDDDWAVKVCEHPAAVPSATAAKNKKRTMGPAEIALQRLYSEHLLYSGPHVKGLLGTILPMQPVALKGKDLQPYYDNKNGALDRNRSIDISVSFICVVTHDF
jgi:hypothetical protein